MDFMGLINLMGFKAFRSFMGLIHPKGPWNLGFKINFLYLLHSEHKTLSSWMDGMIVKYITATGAPKVLKTHKKIDQRIF